MDILKRIHEVMGQEAAAIRSIPVDENFEKAVLALKSCTGKVLTTGIGKAGNIARNSAGILSSTGTPAVFVHPAEAAHGDLGIVGAQDCILAFSTSGKSREVLEMLELSRRLEIKTIIGITSHPDSELRKLSDIILNMGVIKEPCPLGLTPSASIAVMLAIANALAITLMQLKGITVEDYGLRHHGGYLGHRARLENRP